MTTQAAALGNITDFASKPDIQSRNWRTEIVRKRYRLLDKVRELLPNERVAGCLHIPVLDRAVEIWKDVKTGNAHIKGVARCGNAWVCPVCAARVSMGRRSELQDGLEKARERGWYPVFVTYTSRHTREDELYTMREKTRQAQRSLKAGGWWQRNIKAQGLKGVITGIETTYGHKNGWHVHYHALMFFENFVNLKELESKLFERWLTVLERQGLDCDREHGVMVLPGNAASAYVAKWGLEHEVANPQFKKARGDHYNPFQLLELADNGKGWAAAKFLEFANAFKGVSQLRWSKGLRAELELGALASDEELAEEQTSERSVKIASMTFRQYSKLIYRGRQRPGLIGELLMVAECGDLALFAWLLEYNIVLDYG